ncbi:hypothetical protein KOI35_14295 [Actinoplanes bogorensis]|uniref:Fibronectin type-III domain-containing protein n=1 Tax=Paractinoplanes bogorensis TaxID=1610840 RepID=A0ABS5YMM9_9ACTN|nr:hypothetical protein [Actinoplanes bogorensis]MBU2664670.1 hypothetical protein [Actinoplanes bogorensis]
MVRGNGRLRGALIATGAATVAGIGMIVFAAQSSAETNGDAAKVRALTTMPPPAAPAVAMKVTGLPGGVALVEWSEVQAPSGISFTGYRATITDTTVVVVPGPTPTPTPTPPGPRPVLATQELPLTARSARFTGLDQTHQYALSVVAYGTQGQSGQNGTALNPNPVSVTAAPTSVVYGKPATLTIKTYRANQSVLVEKRAQGSPTWLPVKTVKSDVNGTATASVVPAEITAYRVTTPGELSTWPGTASTTVTARFSVTIKASATTIKPNQQITVTGTVRPVKAGTKASLQRKSGATWVTIASSAVKADGTYSIPKTFAKGTWPLHVVITGGTTVAYGTSGQVTVTAK